MYQRLPYHGHCCSTRDDIGLNTQPFSTSLKLSQPFAAFNLYSTLLSLSSAFTQPFSAFLSANQPFSAFSQPISDLLSLSVMAVIFMFVENPPTLWLSVLDNPRGRVDLPLTCTQNRPKLG